MDPMSSGRSAFRALPPTSTLRLNGEGRSADERWTPCQAETDVPNAAGSRIPIHDVKNRCRTIHEQSPTIKPELLYGLSTVPRRWLRTASFASIGLEGGWKAGTMTQNIYDNAEFFEAYSRLSRSIEGLDGAAEWPSLRALLPKLHGLSVVDLGCGFGWFCRWAREDGAAQVLGLDVSERMLARARDTTADPAITYARADMERLDLPEASFDLAYSSLALHYIEGLAGLLATVYRALVPGGHFTFSVEHPIFTAPAN